MKKRFFALIMLIALLVVPALTALASAGDGVFVIDERGLLSASEVEQLNEKAAQIQREQGLTPMFAIVEDAGGSVADYLEALYRRHTTAADGVILGYSNAENKWSCVFFGRAREAFSEADEDALWDAYRLPDTYIAGIGDYFDAASRRYAAFTGGSVPSIITDPTQAPLTTDLPLVTEVPVTAAPIVSGNRVEDSADLLSDAQESALAAKLDEISRKHDCDVVVITAKSLGNKLARLFAADYYEMCGYNMSGGMVMMVCPEQRDYAFVATGKCYDIFNDTKVIDHLKEVVVSDQLAYDRYNSGFTVFADKCDEFLTNVENGKPPYKKNPISLVFAAIGSAVVALVTGGVTASTMESKLKSVRKQQNASEYVQQGSLRMVNQSEMFLYRNVVKTERPRDDNRSGGGSSGGFSSSSGSSWSGSSGKY